MYFKLLRFVHSDWLFGVITWHVSANQNARILSDEGMLRRYNFKVWLKEKVLTFELLFVISQKKMLASDFPFGGLQSGKEH